MDELPKHLGVRKRKNRPPARIDIGIVDAIAGYAEESGGWVKNVLEIGCGTGHFVGAMIEAGYNAVGLDGDPHSVSNGVLSSHEFIRHDFSIEDNYCFVLPSWCNIRAMGIIDLIVSIEFLEHVEEKYQERYMNIFSKSPYVFVTAARKGQRGYHHVNCQNKDYWVEIFSKYGFMYDESVNERILSHTTLQRDTEGRWKDKPTVIERNGMFFFKK